MASILLVPVAHPVATPGGGVLVVATTTGFMPPRLMMAPAGTTLLPRGVHPVVAVPAPAAAGAGCRGAMRWALAAAAPRAEVTGDGDGDDKDNSFYDDMEAQGLKALQMLQCLGSPAGLAAKAGRTKKALKKAVVTAKTKREDKVACVVALLIGLYDLGDLGEKYAVKNGHAMEEAYKPVRVVTGPEGKPTLMVGSTTRSTFDFAPEDTDAMVEAITDAMSFVIPALFAHIDIDTSVFVVPRFQDPEEGW